ncbi:MAG TPA: hypothetical protein DDY78_08890 [Planctomycetales bacterium]|jgi:hypothetical protein|nr:hypothetical protein [Planctomycetales bacterium]
MGVYEDMTGLADELQKGTFSVRTEIKAFPSGEVWLDVHYAGRLFLIVYLRREQCFGVDEYIRERDGIGTDFHFSFQDFESAKAKLLSLLDEAQSAAALAGKSGFGEQTPVGTVHGADGNRAVSSQ